MRSSLFGETFKEKEGAAGEVLMLQNERLLKARLQGTELLARQGAMVAYQGDVRFEFKGAGMGRLLKKMVTGEDLQLMRVHGTGDVFLAKYAEEVHVVWLENESITVNGENVLAFEPSLDWDIRRVKGASGMLGQGLFNVEISGTGALALTAHGTPVVLDAAEQPTFADHAAAIAWSSSLTTRIRKTDGLMKSMIGRGSGELFTMGFEGEGYVIVQPSEGSPYSLAAQQTSSGGGGIGSLFN